MREDDFDDIPELTDEWFAKARPFRQFHDEEFYPGKADEVIASLRRSRGKQKTPTKDRITIRVDSDITAAFRATGRGWQSRMNAVLRQGMPQV